MKKLFYALVFLLCGVASAGAQDSGKVYCLWPSEQGIDNSTPVEIVQVDQPYAQHQILSENGESYYSVTIEKNSPYALFGLGTKDDLTEVVEGNYDIVFDVRSDADFNFHMKVSINGIPDEPLFDFVRDGDWHTVKISLNENYNNIINNYQGYDPNITNFFFAPVFKGLNDTANGESYTVDFKNIKLMPYNRNVPAGTTYIGEVSGETPYSHTISYKMVVNEDQTFNIYANLSPSDIPGFNNSIEIDRLEEALAFMQFDSSNSEYPFSYTTKGTYKEGDEVKFAFRIPVTGDIIYEEISYLFGSVNEALKIGLSAQVTDITSSSANVYYTVDLPDGYEGNAVTVKFDDSIVTENPIALTNLVANTEYSHSLVASTIIDSEEITSKVVKVSFRTDRDSSQEIHSYQIANGFINNAYLPEEDPKTDRRSFPISAIADFCYNPDRTVTVTMKLSGEGTKVVGFVNEINVEEYSGAIFPQDGIYTFTTTTTFDEGKNILPFLHPMYDGGDARIEFSWMDPSKASEPVNYGTPKEILFKADKTIVDPRERVSFYAYIVDENGNYLLDNKPEVKIDENDNEAEGVLDRNFISLNGKGRSTIIASFENLSKSLTILSAKYLSLGILPTACEHAVDLQNVTDNNVGSQATFYCSNTTEHELTIDLGKNFNIELINLVWEGATAMEYDIILSKGENALEQIAATYEITNEIGGGGLTIYRSISVGNTEARFVTLKTKTAFDRTWDIKLKELQVYGNEETYAHVGAFEPLAWHPNFVALEDFIELPEDFRYNHVKAEVSAVGDENWATVDFLNNTPWLKTMYEEIMETGSVTANDGNGVAISRKCDGFYDGNATVQVVKGSADNYATLQLAVDCSGVYRITISSDEEIIFNIDGEGTNGSSVSHDIQIYPTFDHKYSYHHKHISQDGKEYEDDIENDIFNINDYRYKNAEKGLSYPTSTEAIEALKEAVITIPGVFGADVYYWIDATKAAPGEDKNVTTSPSEKEFAKRRAASLPEGYEKYQPIGTYATDLSALANGGTLHLVMAKNGAVTPLETGSNSASQINVTLDDNVETRVEGIATEDNGLVDIYTLQGVCVAKAVNFEAVKTSLTPGIYIVGNKKVAVR
ncbi:MAG: hypothetical protein J1F07_00685 [Muribaculaceae bacterium]|nr:hypothetical protein [Muribaculaceae bacterium]